VTAVRNPDDVTRSRDDVPSSAGEGAVLVITVWREPGHPKSARARITYEDGVTGEGTTTAAANLEQALAIVTEWLARFGDED
jgi:hypothetical protein